MDPVLINDIVKSSISQQLDIPQNELKDSDNIWLLGADNLDYAELMEVLEDEIYLCTKTIDDELMLLLDEIFSLSEFTIGILIQNICDFFKKENPDEKDMGNVSQEGNS